MRITHVMKCMASISVYTKIDGSTTVTEDMRTVAHAEPE